MVQKHVAVIGLAYGDEGKGAVVDRYCATGDYSAVVRFNGGCQAAHNVITDDGRHHTFAQFGSGTLQGVPTYLSEFMMVEPSSLMNEAAGLKSIGVPDPYSLITIHPKSLVTTPYHWLVNRHREDAAGASRHGSCGRGVGATTEYALQEMFPPRIEDLRHPDLMARKLLRLRHWARKNGVEDMLDREFWTERYVEFASLINVSEDLPEGNLVFEGAQGVLLDEHVGFHPYTTWSTVTPHNIFELVPRESVEVIGVTRSYMTRHGAGPFVTEDNSLLLPEIHNGADRYQGAWRVGHLDLPALKYAIKACDGIDGLYITHLDAIIPDLKICTGYFDSVIGTSWEMCSVPSTAYRTREAQTYLLKYAKPVLENYEINVVEMFGVKVVGVGTGPTTKDGIWQ